MKLHIQMYSKKGHYGPTLETTCHTVAGIGEAVMIAIEKNLPDNLEGVALIDWTKIKVEVTRS